MAREASPPEWDRLTPNKQTTMFRGEGGEPSSRPKVHTKIGHQPSQAAHNEIFKKTNERTGAATKRRGAATGRGCRVKGKGNEEEQRAKGTDETRG